MRMKPLLFIGRDDGFVSVHGPQLGQGSPNNLFARGRPTNAPFLAGFLFFLAQLRLQVLRSIWVTALREKSTSPRWIQYASLSAAANEMYSPL